MRVVGRNLDDGLYLETINAYSSPGDFSEARKCLAMARFELHQRVRVITLLSPKTNDLPGRDRTPRVGDEGWIVNIYSEPREAYCVECTDDRGTIWLSDFLPEELDDLRSQ